MKAHFYGRFSSKKQKEGNSQERQVELARTWCERKGIVLDETVSYFDDGVSGFNGDLRTRKSAGLYLFLQACAAKQVAPGDYLLVECLDRLSREQLQEGQRLIHSLLFDHRIKLVVLFTGMEYTAENYQQTHWSIDAEFDRAHSESFSKSVRSKDNWERRRRGVASGGIVTGKVPSWVRVEDGRLVLDEKKAEIVRDIFALSISGFGQQVIAKKLNEGMVTPISGSEFWHESYVQKILTDRAVLGEYQPRRKEGGKRVVAGAVVPNYFPVVITTDVWLKNRLAMASRLCERGKITPQVSNLFTNLVYEGGERMGFRSKGLVGYLQTARKRSPGVKYDPFERAILWWTCEVQLCLSNTINVDDLRVRAAKLDRKLKALKANIDNDTEGELAELVESFRQAKRDRAELEKQIEAATVPLQTQFLHTRRLIEALSAAKDGERETMRREVRLAIRQVASRIDVEIIGKTKGPKRFNLTVTMKDGKQRCLFFTMKAGRVTDGGFWAIGNTDGRAYDTFTGFGDMTPFPVDTDPAQEVSDKCREMRAAGKSYKAICAALGVVRSTVYRYINGRK